MIYFMRICNTGALLVSNEKLSSDLIRACSDDSHEYARIRYTRMNFMNYGVWQMVTTYPVHSTA